MKPTCGHKRGPPAHYLSEVRTIYPHRDSVPREVWLSLFGSAERVIDILDNSSLFLAADPETFATLTNRARTGVQERICLTNPDWPGPSGVAYHIREALSRCTELLELRSVQVRLHRTPLNNAIYRADDELLVSQQAFGIPAGRAPVVHLRRADDRDLATTYIESIGRIWARAQPLAELP